MSRRNEKEKVTKNGWILDEEDGITLRIGARRRKQRGLKLESKGQCLK